MEDDFPVLQKLVDKYLASARGSPDNEDYGPNVPVRGARFAHAVQDQQFPSNVPVHVAQFPDAVQDLQFSPNVPVHVAQFPDAVQDLQFASNVPAHVAPFAHGVQDLQFPSNVPVRDVQSAQAVQDLQFPSNVPVHVAQFPHAVRDLQFPSKVSIDIAQFARAMQDPQLCSNVLAHGVPFPAMPDQQQFFLDAQSIPPYCHPQQINLHSQQLEAQHTIQAHGNLTARLMSESPRQPYFELPISQQEPFNSVDRVTGRVYPIAEDRRRCTFLKSKLANGSPEDIEKIFLEIIDHIVELTTHSPGSYLVEKLLEVCDEALRIQILQRITRESDDLVMISCNRHGAWVVRKVIETLRTPEEFAMLVSALKPGILTIVKSLSGHHVALRCLERLMPEYNKFLIEAATTNCVKLAQDRYGSYVLQRCLSYCNGEQRNRFLDGLKGRYAELSLQKAGSRVVEKCLECAGEEQHTCLIEELIRNPWLDQIMEDPYGNYVIQAALKRSKGQKALHNRLLAAIKEQKHVLQTSPYWRKLLSVSVVGRSKDWI